MKSIIRVALSSVIAIGIGSSNVAAQDERGQVTEQARANDVISADVDNKKIEAGRSAYIDPDTGELRSTPAVQEKASSTNEDVSTERVDIVEPDLVVPQEIEHPDGTVEIVLNGQVDSALQVTLDCDGNTKTKHAENDKSMTKTDACQ